jgi:hypothetical protein
MSRQQIGVDRFKTHLAVARADVDRSSSTRRGRIDIETGASTSARGGPVVAVGLLTTLTLVLLQALTQAINFGFFDLRIKALDCDNHFSVFGIASLAAELAAGAAIAWRGGRSESRPWVCRPLGALVAGLVVLRALTTFNAAVLAAPLTCVLVLVFWLTWRDAPLPRATVWSALVLMTISLLLHKVGLAADSSPASDYTWAYQITGIVKHGCEFGGWMLLVTGVLAGDGGHRDPVGATTGIPSPNAAPRASEDARRAGRC